jgi:F-type H+-transporting ATPase subunit delta
MAKGVSGKRHAQAVFRLALETSALDRWQTDLTTMVEVMGDSQVIAFLESPRLSAEKKRDSLRGLLAGVSPAALNLGFLLVSRNRLRIVHDLANEYMRLVNTHYGREEAEVTTAVPISQKEQEAIAKGLARVAGKEIVLKLKVDPDIMGGLVARIGDKLLDGSVRTRLKDLRSSLA